MPAADAKANENSGQCAVCELSSPVRGLFATLDPSIPSPICFACIFVHTLKGCRCVKCGSPVCIGFVTFEVEEAGRIAPAPVCPVCILQSEGDEFDAIIDTDRSVIREAGTV